MKKLDSFINCYSVSKTLRFKAIPVGATQENIEKRRILEEDEMRAEDYKAAKKIIDRYYVDFINRGLHDVQLVDLNDYAKLYMKNERTEAENEKMKKFEDSMRKQIVKVFEDTEEYKKIRAKALITELMPAFLTDDDEKEIINSFRNFTTAFTGFWENRANMFSKEAKSSAIGYRCINENLPRFMSNIKIYKRIEHIFSDAERKEIETEIIIGYHLEDFFAVDFFNFLLPQDGIDTYNAVIGGYTKEDGTKVKGLNEYINLYNQKNKEKLPSFKLLYKQVLSDRESMSFYADGYKDDKEVINALQSVTGEGSVVKQAVEGLDRLFGSLENYDYTGIYVKNGPAVTTLSNDLFGSWNVVSDAWNKQYDAVNHTKEPKDLEKYYDVRRKAYKKMESISLSEMEVLAQSENIIPKLTEVVKEKITLINNAYSKAGIYASDFSVKKSLKNDDVTVEKIKEVLDSLKELENYVKPFIGTGKENNRDERFYGIFTECMDKLSQIDHLYNAVRDYVTQKPYATDKFKLYFENPQFMGGWDVNKESDYRCALLRKDNKYFLAVMDKAYSKCLSNVKAGADSFEKIVYKQIADATKYLSSKQIIPQNPPARIVEILKNKKANPNLLENEKNELIDYIKEDFLVNYDKLKDENGNPYFSFDFKPAKDYKRFNDFCTDVEAQAYTIKTQLVSSEYINKCIEEGKLYLFELYNKDFSEKSHGTANLHTMYFKSLFSDNNNGEIRLCGGAEMFLRRASLKKEELVVHPANQPMDNKNPDNPKKQTTLPYAIYKDRRYSEDQYEIHIPIAINKIPANPIPINNQVRRLLKEDKNPYIIGIDRGERNLLYIVVIDGKGNIVEQYSLNEIINECNGITIRTDYHTLLDQKEKERLAARQNWKSIENIKELKEGYISQVVHKICGLVTKYDAVIAMEDLNSGFKNSRLKVEKQVYQKFEKMLIDKLNYMVDKHIAEDANGGVLHGYQIANKFESFKRMRTQNGFIFYIPAWLTSKIDPATGFANLMRTKYVSVAESQKFISSFDKIYYDKSLDMFAFDFDYSNFARGEVDYKKKWTIYTNGSRIRTFRNPKKNNEFDNEIVVLTDTFKELFNHYGISFADGCDFKENILAQTEKEFYVALLGKIGLMLQLRNSITGRTDVDYLISPVRGKDGSFYDSRDYENKDNATMPNNADANGAYNIARKVLWAIEQFKAADNEELAKVSIAISNKEWLKYAQTH